MLISVGLVLTICLKGVLLQCQLPHSFYPLYDDEPYYDEIYRPIRGPPFKMPGQHGNGKGKGHQGHGGPPFAHGNPHGGPPFGHPHGGHGHGKGPKKEPSTTTIQPPTRKPPPTVQASTPPTLTNFGKDIIDIRIKQTDTRRKRATDPNDEIEEISTEIQLRYNDNNYFPFREPSTYNHFNNYPTHTHYPRLSTCVQKKFDCVPLDECKSALNTNFENKICRLDYETTYVCCERSGKNDKLRNYEMKCGRKPVRNRFSEAIIGGTNVEGSNVYPWMTAIGEMSQNGSIDWYCGGALIGERTIITAAHCISKRQADMVRLGDVSLSKDKSIGVQEIPIGSTLIHPLFRFPQLYNDLALLFLDKPIKYTPSIRPICVSQRTSVSQTPLALLTGWGQLSFASDQSTILQEVSVQVFNNSYCDQQYALTQASKRNFPRGILDVQLCAGDENGGKDACQGDSGAPLVTEENGQFALIGIVSAGIGCGSRTFPGVYTRVAAFTPWILENLE